MSKQLHKALFSESECLTDLQLYNYIDKKLTAQEQHVVEKHLLSCELCSDALEGLSLIKNRNVIEETVKAVKIKYSTGEKETSTTIIPFQYIRKLAMAASIALLICSTFIYLYYFNKADNNLSLYNKPTVAKENTDEGKAVPETLQQETDNVPEKFTNTQPSNPTIAITKEQLKTNKNDDDAKAGADEDVTEKAVVQKEKEQPIKTDENNNSVAVDTEVKPQAYTTNEASSTGESEKARYDTDMSAKKMEEPQKNKSVNSKSNKDLFELAKNGKAASTEPAPEALSLSIPAANTGVSKPEATTSVPKYMEGYDAMLQFIKNNTNLSNCNDCQGTVSLRFIVKADGTLKNIQPIAEVKKCKCLTTEAIRIVQLMPAWTPAQKAGVNVDYEYTLPITF